MTEIGRRGGVVEMGEMRKSCDVGDMWGMGEMGELS